MSTHTSHWSAVVTEIGEEFMFIEDPESREDRIARQNHEDVRAERITDLERMMWHASQRQLDVIELVLTMWGE